jgi:hypothetical protein
VNQQISSMGQDPTSTVTGVDPALAFESRLQVKRALFIENCDKEGDNVFFCFKKKFSTPSWWFYFLLHIAITIINCNSSTSNVGGCLLPRLSE